MQGAGDRARGHPRRSPRARGSGRPAVFARSLETVAREVLGFPRRPAVVLLSVFNWCAEDRALCVALLKHGECNWKAIAASVGSRNHMQCLQRWKKVLKPGLSKGNWTAPEDEALARAPTATGLAPGAVGGAPARPPMERQRPPGHRDPRREDLRGVRPRELGPHLTLLAADQAGPRGGAMGIATAFLSDEIATGAR